MQLRVAEKAKLPVLILVRVRDALEQEQLGSCRRCLLEDIGSTSTVSLARLPPIMSGKAPFQEQCLASLARLYGDELTATTSRK